MLDGHDFSIDVLKTAWPAQPTFYFNQTQLIILRFKNPHKGFSIIIYEKPREPSWKPPLFLGWAPTTICHFFHLSIRLSVYLSIYLSICLLWTISEEPYTCKMMISLVFFSFFVFLFFLQGGRGVVRGVERQNIAKNEKHKLHPSHIISQEQYSIWYDHNLWYTCLKWWYLHAFFLFLLLKFCFFGLLSG